MAAVKHEFGKFGDVLAKVKRQLDTASRSIDETGTRTRVMVRKLDAVEKLPESDALSVLGLPGEDGEGVTRGGSAALAEASGDGDPEESA